MIASGRTPITALQRIAAALVVALPLFAQAEPLAQDSGNDLDSRLQSLRTLILDAAVAADSPAADSQTGTGDVIPAPVQAPPATAADGERLAPGPRWLSELVDRALPSRAAARTHDQPGAANDPRWQEAARLLEQGQPFTAARALQQMRRSLEAAGLAPPPDWTALLARCLLAYGTPEPAKALLETLPPADRGDDVRLRAQLALAEFQFRHSEADEALATIDALPPRLRTTAGDALDYDTRMLQALVLMSLHQDRRAAAVLPKIQPDPQRLVSAPASEVYRALLPQYNLGIALLRSGQIEPGRAVLDRIGRLDARGAALQALRDQANLVLGWQFLREAQGGTAGPIFERVSLEGPASNRALLGLGWAALAPQGSGQARNDIAVAPDTARDTPKFVLKALRQRRLINCEEFNRLSRAPQDLCNQGPKFTQAAAPDDPSRRAESALAPWIELQARDPGDPAVRESWTALPHALAQLGALREAQAAYERAIAKLEAERTAGATMQDALHDGEPVLSIPDPAMLREPAAPIAVALEFEILRNHGLEAVHEAPMLTAALSNLLDSLWLQQQATMLSMPADVIERAGRLRIDCERDVRQIAMQALAERQQTLERYLDAARSGLARLYDPSASAPADQVH